MRLWTIPATDIFSFCPVRIGAAVQVAEGVSILGPSVIDDGVRIEAGARLERSICWQRSTIGARAALRDAIVGKEYAVVCESVLDGTLVAREN